MEYKAVMGIFRRQIWYLMASQCDCMSLSIMLVTCQGSSTIMVEDGPSAILVCDVYSLFVLRLFRSTLGLVSVPEMSTRRYTRDRDNAETLTFRDRDETETLPSPAETRRSHFETSQDVCRSRD